MKLFDSQLKQCNRLADDAKAFAKEDLSDEEADEVIAKLYQVKEECPLIASLCG